MDLEKFMQLFFFILSTIIKTCISLYLTVVIILPVFSILWLVNEIVRIYASFRLKTNYGKLYTLVSNGEDSIWSFKKPGNSRNNLIFTVYKNIINSEKYQAKFSEKVLGYVDNYGKKPYEKLFKIFTHMYGYCCWKTDTNFDIQNHVRIFEFESQNKDDFNSSSIGSGRDFVMESDLPKILSGLAKDMPETHPQWEEIIIPRFVYNKDVIANHKNAGAGESMLMLKPEAKIQSAKIFRFHHAYMDGLSALTMMKTCMVEGELHLSVDPLKPINTDLWKKTLQFLYIVVFGASKLLGNIFNEASADSRYAVTRYSGTTHYTWSDPIDMKLLENIKSKTNCSVTEIITSAFGGALRSVSEHYCKKPEWLIFPDSFEDSVFTGIPKPILPFPNESPRNRFGFVGMNISTAKVDSRLERLKSTKEGYKVHVRGSPVPLLNYLLMSFLGRFPNWVIQRLVGDTGAPVIFSNTSWIQNKISLMGDELEELATWMPLLSSTGVGVFSAKYCDSMRLCGVTEVSCMSFNELNYLLNVMRNEIILLEKECEICPSLIQLPSQCQ